MPSVGTITLGVVGGIIGTAIFAGPSNDLLTGAKRRGNARDWERPTV
jgi:hypothetical protein